MFAAGDGKIVFRGVQNGYGNTVILQHGGNITTLYAHLSRFRCIRDSAAGSTRARPSLMSGSPDSRRGRISTTSTASSGVHRNPRTVTLPPANPIPAEQWEAFRDGGNAVSGASWISIAARGDNSPNSVRRQRPKAG